MEAVRFISQTRKFSMFVVFCVLFSTLVIANPTHAFAYASCGNNSANDDHCYDHANWYGTWGGSSAYIFISQVTNPSPQLTNEMWLVDVDNAGAGCSNLQGHHSCWVEGGILYQRSITGTTIAQFFHARRTPNQGYAITTVDTVRPSDYGQFLGLTLEIGPDGKEYMYFGMAGRTFFPDNYDNAIQPDKIQIGQELVGDAGAIHAGASSWSQNIWIDSANYNIHYQTEPVPYFNTDIEITPDTPLSAYWYSYPSATPNGGIWYANGF